MNRLLKNIIKLQLGKNLKLQLELRPLLKAELLNGKDFDMLSPNQREYISNVYAKEELGEAFLRNGLKPEQRENINLCRLAIYNETGSKVTQKQLRSIESSFVSIIPENQSTVNELVIQAEKHYQAYKQLGSKQDYKMYRELMLSVASLCTPIQFDNNKRANVKKQEAPIDMEYSYNTVRAMLKDYYMLRDNSKYNDYYIDLERVLQVVKLNDNQIELLHDLIHHQSIGNKQTESLKLAIKKLVKYLNEDKIYKMKVINNLYLFV